MFTAISTRLQNGLFSRSNNFIKRWPTQPKIAMYGPPNVFMDEISTRLAIDLGVPLLNPSGLIQSAANAFETDPQFNHPFYQWINEAVRRGDGDAIQKEKILLKLLQLEPSYQEGFVLNDVEGVL